MKRTVLITMIALTASPAAGSCLPSKLQTWVNKAKAECSLRVTSTFRKNAIIRGSGGSRSLHASCQAADIVGPPACLYRALRDFPGQMSTDYARCCHVHIDVARWGQKVRFKHAKGPCGC